MKGFVVAEMESQFNKEQDESEYRCFKPIQWCETIEQAEHIVEIFNPFYNYDLSVVPDDELEEWRR